MKTNSPRCPCRSPRSGSGSWTSSYRAAPHTPSSTRCASGGRSTWRPSASPSRSWSRRHEVLRSTFPSVSGRPVQVAQPPAPLEVPLIDLRSVPAREAAGRARPSARRGGRATSLAHLRAAAQGLPLSAGGRGARADSRRPPHRLRRLVGRGASVRARRALRRLPPRRALLAARARTAVRRLRRLAARVADR